MNNRHSNTTGRLAVAIAATLCAAGAQAADVYLRAESFTKALPGGGSVAMWGYSACDAGFATCGAPSSPGPEIVVPPGDTSLTVHLQNNLREPTSIVIPNQSKSMAPVSFTDAQGRKRISSFDAEAAPGGGVQAYTWPNLKPGAYLYQSGSHVQLQVQMGLYGSVVNDAATGGAYAGVPYAQSKTLVFSEIDPLLHQAFTSPLLAASFEAPDADPGAELASAGGWSVTGRGGVFDPVSDATVVASDGEQTGWVAGGGVLSLAAGVLGPDTGYSLSVDVGDRSDTDFGGYSIGLYAGGTLLAGDADQATPGGGFVTRALALPAGAPAMAGHYGEPLEIRLSSTAGAVPGASVAVAGSSFEAPAVADGAEGATATGWALSGAGAGGVFNPAAASVPQPSDGAQAGWSNGQRQFAQALGETLAADTTYSVSVDVGDRSDTPFAGYRIGLYAAGTLLAESADGFTPDGAYQTANLSYTSPSSVTAGQALELRLASTAAAPAPASVTVTNFSFEDPAVLPVVTDPAVSSVAPSGWNRSSTNAGVYRALGGNLATDGNQVAVSRQTASLTQTTGEVLTANSTYTLSVDVGRSPSGFVGYAGYSVQLLAGSTVVATATYSGGQPGTGSFKTATGSVEIQATHAQLGQALQVRLASTSNTASARTYFDNVRLTRVTADTSRTYFDNVRVTKTPPDPRRTLFDNVALTASAVGKAANALDRAAHPQDGYQPNTFLLNGEAGPTTLLTAAPGDRVLLRLVNAGLQNRAPQLIGGYFEIVAEDGNRSPVARRQHTALLPPGKSLDVVFVAPATPGTYTIYDRRLGLSEGSGQIGRIVVSP